MNQKNHLYSFFQSSALFYGNAFIVSAIPLWLFWRVHSMEPVSSAPLFAVVTLISTWLVAFAYRNTKHLLKHQVYSVFLRKVGGRGKLRKYAFSLSIISFEYGVQNASAVGWVTVSFTRTRSR